MRRGCILRERSRECALGQAQAQAAAKCNTLPPPPGFPVNKPARACSSWSLYRKSPGRGRMRTCTRVDVSARHTAAIRPAQEVRQARGCGGPHLSPLEQQRAALPGAAAAPGHNALRLGAMRRMLLRPAPPHLGWGSPLLLLSTSRAPLGQRLPPLQRVQTPGSPRTPPQSCSRWPKGSSRRHWLQAAAAAARGNWEGRSLAVSHAAP